MKRGGSGGEHERGPFKRPGLVGGRMVKSKNKEDQQPGSLKERSTVQ